MPAFHDQTHIKGLLAVAAGAPARAAFVQYWKANHANAHVFFPREIPMEFWLEWAQRIIEEDPAATWHVVNCGIGMDAMLVHLAIRAQGNSTITINASDPFLGSTAPPTTAKRAFPLQHLTLAHVIEQLSEQHIISVMPPLSAHGDPVNPLDATTTGRLVFILGEFLHKPNKTGTCAGPICMHANYCGTAQQRTARPIWASSHVTDTKQNAPGGGTRIALVLFAPLLGHPAPTIDMDGVCTDFDEATYALHMLTAAAGGATIDSILARIGFQPSPDTRQRPLSHRDIKLRELRDKVAQRRLKAAAADETRHSSA